MFKISAITHLKWPAILVAGWLLLLGGCSKDFLDVKPKGQVIAEKASDYNNLLEDETFTYLTNGTVFMDAQHIMGDDVAGLTPHYTNTTYFGAPDTRRPHFFAWADEVYLTDQDDAEVSAFYNRIYAANKIVNEVMDATSGTEQQKKQYQAEGLAQRAFSYFMLINYFGKPYMDASASTDPGVPLILKGDFTQSDFTRASVKTVYDQIVSDLTTAINALPAVQTDANRFTLSAGEALLGKVYLFMRDWNNAVKYLDKSIADLPTSFSTGGNIGLINYNTATVSNAVLGYVFQVPGMGTAAAQANGYPETLNAALVAGVYWLGYAAPLIISPDTYALLGANDLRKKLYSNTYSIVASGGSSLLLPAGLYRSKNGYIGNSIGIQLPDIYLLDAEAKARTGDIAGATSSLLTLRKNRMPLTDASAGIPATQDELIRFIIQERRREFATLGFRWFDMRRLSIDPLFQDATYTHRVYDGTSGVVIETYTLRPERFMLRFTASLMDQSPGLVNNP